jgi:hypothetical protein
VLAAVAQWERRMIGLRTSQALFSSIDLLKDNDARRGIMPPSDARARKRRSGSSRQ